ncbi:hypothetical protein GCM10027168_44470 [Streptomyces capparidis]
MIRVITSSTHRAYQDAVTRAGQVPGLETELADVREQRDTFWAQVRADQELLDQLTCSLEGLERECAGLRRAVKEIAAALVGAGDAEAARREVARLLLRHCDDADLEVLTEPPVVHLYLHQGVVRSAHRTGEDARRAAEADGAAPDGWFESRADDRLLPLFSVHAHPVRGAWPDRGRVYLLLRDGWRLVAVFGTRDAACDEQTSMLAAHGLMPVVREMEMGTAAPLPVPTSA